MNLVSADTPSYLGPTGRFSRIDLYDPVVRWTLREKRFKTALLRQAALQAGQKVLDLGCGTGTLVSLLVRRYAGVRVVALDADPQALARARRKLDPLSGPVHLLRGLCQQLPFPPNCFDCVLSTLLFHHLHRHDKQATLGEIYRVLRPGGQLHLADFGPPANGVLRFAFRAVQWADGRETTEDNLLGRLPEMISRAGFAHVQQMRRLNTWVGTLYLYRAVKPPR